MEKPPRQVTRKDVALEANVSETIVSYVINNNRYVDKDKRKRVEDAIEKLHYRPNNIARALKGKTSNSIVFIVDQIISEHYSLLLSEMDKSAYNLGYLISICSNRNTDEFVNEIINRHYDGIIISSISFKNEYIQQLVNAKIPVVLINNRNYESIRGAGKIDSGLYRGARESVNLLINKGCKNIIYIDRFSNRGHFGNMDDLRYKGFYDHIKESGLVDTPEKNIITGCSDAEEVANKIKIYLDNYKVDGIIARNDKMACIALKALQSKKINVPEQVKIVGFDNSMLSVYSTPTITSVEMQRKEIAYEAIKMLQSMITSHITPTDVSFNTRIILRESTY